MRRFACQTLSQKSKTIYEQTHYRVTLKQPGTYSDPDLDLLEHCEQRGIPYLLIHKPRRFCTIEADWAHPCGFDLDLPSYTKVRKQAESWLERSPASKGSKSVRITPRDAEIRGLELEQAQLFCRWLWEYIASGTIVDRGGAA